MIDSCTNWVFKELMLFPKLVYVFPVDKNCRGNVDTVEFVLVSDSGCWILSIILIYLSN